MWKPDPKFLVDCGMEQGINVYENAELPVPYSEIDYVLLTHAHIDHAGLLPYIYARGFRGQIVTTIATADLCDIMLRDSAHIQEMEEGPPGREKRDRAALHGQRRQSGAPLFPAGSLWGDGDADGQRCGEIY